MQVEQLAKDLKVKAGALVSLLRKMGISVSDAKASVSDADVSRVLAKVEREKRAGKKDASQAIAAALEEVSSGTKTRRRRRSAKAEPEEEPEVVEEVPAEEPEADAPAVEAVEEADADKAPTVEPVEEPVEVAAKAETPVAEPAAAAAPAAEPADEAVVAGTEVVAEPVAKAPKAAAAPAKKKLKSAKEAAAEEAAAKAAAAGGAAAPAADGTSPEPVRVNASKEPTRRFRKPQPAASAGPGGTVRIQAEGYTADGRRDRKDKKKKRGGVDQTAVQDNLARVMNELKGGGKKKSRKKGRRPSREEVELEEMVQEEERERELKTVRVNEFLTVAELAELMDVSVMEIIGSAFKNLSLMVTINQRLDFDQIEMLLDEFGFAAVREEDYTATEEVEEEEEDPALLLPRPPVVTVMGHVDHGKTLLLDRIRNTNVVAGEAGGITQHIGAYHVELADGRMVSFLDTPGHAAFTAMRARGADVTDIVILIVAADDSVMPQTIEAISHAKSAGVPMIVAINKCDLPAADPGRVKTELLQYNVQVEDFGGSVLSAEISAKAGTGIDDLLEKVLLQAELLELKANPNRPAVAAVIEAQLDVGKGSVVTVMVEKGTLRVGDSFVVGRYEGRVRALLDERGHNVDAVGPGIPVQILGTAGVPQAGDSLNAMDADRASEIAETRQRLDREKQLRVKERGLKLGDFSALMAEGGKGTLPLVIKGDVDGSVQAVSDALEQLGTDEVRVEIVHRGVGAINESDILLAETTKSVIIGFRVRPDTKARNLAEDSGVDIQTYDVIYNAVDDIRDALEGMLSPEQREEILGTAEVRETFRITKVGMIAGCYVTQGVIEKKGKGRLVRDGIVMYEGAFSSLKRFKDDAKEVREGFECGIGIENFNDIKVGDVIECFKVEEIARTLAESAQGSKTSKK